MSFIIPLTFTMPETVNTFELFLSSLDLYHYADCGMKLTHIVVFANDSAGVKLVSLSGSFVSLRNLTC